MHLIAILLIVGIALVAASSSGVSIDPNSPPKTVQFDGKLKIKSDDLPQDNNRVKKASKGCELPEQVHLSFWSDTAVLVSWATCDAQLGNTKPVSTSGIRSAVYYGKSNNQLDSTAEGAATSYAYDYSSLGYGTSYASPVLHHVLLKDLTPGQTYYYKLASSTSDTKSKDKKDAKLAASGKVYSFTLPKPQTFPLRVGIFGDPGQTYNTTTTLDRLVKAKPDLLLMTGDFTYADIWIDAKNNVPKDKSGTVTYQPKWDTFGRLFEPLLAYVPMMFTNANHEIEQLPNGDRDTAYNYRFPTPYFTNFDTSKGPTEFRAVNAKGDRFANLYYASELPGVMKVISLTSYAPGQTFSHDEPQYKWLQQELAKIDRSKTPWLIVNIHAPWYNTYQGHFKENECMRQAYEGIFRQYGVDLVFHGHVHSYERTKPMFDYTVTCGPMYTTIGDAGNAEGLYKEFIDQDPKNQPSFCSDPKSSSSKVQLFPSTYQPQACYSFQDGKFCFDTQPDWSAYRQPSFGYGMLVIESPTRATWSWYRNEEPAWKVADKVTILCGSESSCGTSGDKSKDSKKAGNMLQ